jgi:glycerol-3-phosphate O-acyltransferase
MRTWAIVVGVVFFLTMILAAFLRRHARILVRTRRLRIDRFKLRKKHTEIRLEVFGSRDVVSAIKAYAKAHKVSLDAADRQARIYLAEIVPKFNLLAYYRFGAPIASALLRFLYRVVVERKPIRDFNERAGRNAAVVYLINHRSNVDYLLVAHMLFKFISLSYAVGEWARVWPLNHLFKWFGGYFVRRHFREPLYHAILSQFVATITRTGVTQGVFLEGGLSRDGAFQKPKLGMLDYIVASKRDPSFTAPLYFIPTAVNYDRILEDRVMTEELVGKEDRSTRWQKLRTTGEFLFKNTLRSVLRRFKRYGYAVVSFGEPILVDDFIRDHPALLAEDFTTRKTALQELAELVMRRISDALPVVPVPLLARIFAIAGERGLTEAEILERLAAEQRALANRLWLTRERTPELLWRSAREVLELRKLISFDGERWEWTASEHLMRDYYAASLATFDEVKARGWPEKTRAHSPQHEDVEQSKLNVRTIEPS